MKIIVTILFGLMCVLQVNAQKLTRKTFAKTEWFSDNNDSIFYKSDTIKLIKYSNLVSNDLGFNEYAESEGLLFKNPIYVHFKFNRFGTLDFWNIKYHWSTVSRMGERKWRFFRKGNLLLVYRNNKIELRLKPILIKEIEVKSAYKEFPNPIKTIEITFVKNN